MSSHILQGLYSLVVLAVFIATILTAIISCFQKGASRTSATNLLIVLATLLPILIVGTSFFPKSNKTNNPLAFKPSEQVDSLAYGLNQATELKYAAEESPLVAALVKSKFLVHAPESTFEADQDWLVELLKKDSADSEGIAIRLALIGTASGTDQCKMLNKYDSEFAEIMQAVLCDKKQSPTPTRDQCIDSIKAELPAGWYKETALLAAYKHFGDTNKIDSILAERKSQGRAFSYKLLVNAISYLLLCLTGLVVIVRSSPSLFSLKEQMPWTADWGIKKIWSVCLCALYAQAIFGLISYGVLYVITKDVSSSANVIIVDIATIAATMVSVLIAARQILLKPLNLNLLDGLYFRSDQSSLSKCIQTGFYTYCAAITLVLIVSSLERAFIGHSLHTENPITMRMVAIAIGANPITISLLFIAAGVIAPVYEEILFRGLLYPYLRKRMSMWPAALLSGTLFSLCHWDLPMIAQIAILGTLQAVAVERTRSLTTSIVMHGLWNSGLFLALIMLR
jgi:membrane protease YdiL (CAAX protease family)